MKNDSKEFDSSTFVVNSLSQKTNNLINILTDIAIVILLAFKQEDVISIEMAKQEAKNKLFVMFHTSKYNNRRIEYETIEKPILKKLLISKYSLDEEKDAN